MKKITFVLPLALALVSSSALAIADELYSFAKDLLTSEGYQEAFPHKSGSMGEGAAKTYDVSVGKGTYAFIGVCDENCADLDITVKNSSGRVIVKDTLEDDFPVAEFNFSAPTKVKVEVKMESCDAAKCNYAFGAFIDK